MKYLENNKLLFDNMKFNGILENNAHILCICKILIERAFFSLSVKVSPFSHFVNYLQNIFLQKVVFCNNTYSHFSLMLQLYCFLCVIISLLKMYRSRIPRFGITRLRNFLGLWPLFRICKINNEKLFRSVYLQNL